MAIPLAMLGGAALSPLQGLGFGFGYGYGVRLGYHSFKPSKNPNTTALRLSSEPATAGVGMGLASAEEMHQEKKMPLKMTTQPTPTVDPNTSQREQLKQQLTEKWADVPMYERREAGAVVERRTKQWVHEQGAKAGLDHYQSWKAWIKRRYPFNRVQSRRS